VTASLVNELIEAADALPAHLRDWLVDGLQAWQQGRDLEAALGLHDDDSDYCSMALYERDDLIRVAIRLCPGDSESAQASFFLEVMQGHLQHPDETGRRFVYLLRGARVYVPKTLRHLRRILAGRRCDGWRYQEDTGRLCPSPVQRFNNRTLTKTGT
jgi:hypothetical protein